MALQQVDACNIDNRMKSQQVELEEMTSWSWDEMWTWEQPISKKYSVSYERFDGKSLSLQHQLAYRLDAVVTELA